MKKNIKNILYIKLKIIILFFFYFSLIKNNYFSTDLSVQINDIFNQLISDVNNMRLNLIKLKQINPISFNEFLNNRFNGMVEIYIGFINFSRLNRDKDGIRPLILNNLLEKSYIYFDKSLNISNIHPQRDENKWIVKDFNNVLLFVIELITKEQAKYIKYKNIVNYDYFNVEVLNNIYQGPIFSISTSLQELLHRKTTSINNNFDDNSILYDKNICQNTSEEGKKILDNNSINNNFYTFSLKKTGIILAIIIIVIGFILIIYNTIKPYLKNHKLIKNKDKDNNKNKDKNNNPSLTIQ